MLNHPVKLTPNQRANHCARKSPISPIWATSVVAVLVIFQTEFAQSLASTIAVNVKMRLLIGWINKAAHNPWETAIQWE